MARDKRHKYSEALKRKVIKEVMSGKHTASAAGRDYGIKGHGTIGRWIQEYQLMCYQEKEIPMPEAMPGEEKDLREKIKALELENAVLRAYKDILDEEEAAKMKKKMDPDSQESQ